MSRAEAADLARDLHTLRDRVILDYSKRSLLDTIDDMLRKVEPLPAPVSASREAVVS